jgi:site-specific DNA-methyltransferase (adenine-specific)
VQVTYTIHRGDCLDILPTLAANSVDTIITDPPYGLAFMGKDWDHGVPGAAFWAAALRVAKPGAMLLAFGGSRTFHRLTCAIEDAGWEVRDCLMWLYGSGFPKSLDISKAIDKAAGEVRGVVGMKHKIGRPNAANQSWARNGKSAGADYATHPKTLGIGMETAPATDAARTWHGWGTALKPAWEPIILAMKPLDGTFADNAQQWGVAGINVDGARIGTSDVMRRANNVTIGGNGIYGGGKPATTGALPGQGRWPANLLLDEEAAAALDAQSGERPSGGKKGGYGPGAADGGMWSQSGPRPCGLTHGDTGGASRFFYVAKASRADRGEGNIHPTCKPTELMRYLCRLTSTPTGGVVLDPFMGSGTTGVAAVQEGRAFIGIEKEAEYHEIARRRIEGVQPTLLQAAD